MQYKFKLYRRTPLFTIVNCIEQVSVLKGISYCAASARIYYNKQQKGNSPSTNSTFNFANKFFHTYAQLNDRETYLIRGNIITHSPGGNAYDSPSKSKLINLIVFKGNARRASS